MNEYDNSLNLYQEFENPLEDLIAGAQVCYPRGGIFELRYIKNDVQSNNGTIYFDYDIMIEDVESEADYAKLRQIEAKSEKLVASDLAEIKHMLKGIGRLVQYSCDDPSELGDGSK